MPNGSNPYLEELLAWIDTIDPEWGSMVEAGEAYETNPMGQQPFGLESQLYQYSGVPQEIMSAISNVFSFPTGTGEWSDPQLGINAAIDELGMNIWQTQPSITDMNYPELINVLTPNLTEGGLAADIYGYDAESGELGDLLYEAGNYGLLPFTNIFDPESIANTLSQIEFGAGYTPSQGIRGAEVRALTPEMVEKTGSAYYEPYESSEREELVDKLGKAVGKVSTGGFAGSGARQAGLSSAEQGYEGGYANILKDI